MKLMDYQQDCVEKLIRGFKELVVAGNPNATMVLKAPTGSGKTVMVASMLQGLADDKLPENFVFIWASMGDLAHQSYDKLSQQYMPDSCYNMLELEGIEPEALEPNTILFCNWEKMYQQKMVEDDDGNTIEIFNNVYVRIGEDGRNLQEILEKTREEGTKIVLIVDEAHRTYLGKNSQKLVHDVIKPDLIIEVSATPLTNPEPGYYEMNTGRWIEVSFEKVIESGMIKNNTVINNNIAGSIGRTSADTVVLDAALKQREMLARKYKEAGSNINPLILVQLPSENATNESATDISTRETVEKFMEERGITYDNGKLGVWVSNNKWPNDIKEACPKPDSKIEVLIFKQAIATGWDCPRAAILVMLRDIKSVTFEVQTVGRILRMPEQHHYEDQALNSAYVFTNVNELALSEDKDTQVFFKTQYSYRRDGIDDFIWPSVHRERVVGQRNRLNQAFRPILLPVLNSKFGIKRDDDASTRRKKIDILLEIDAKELEIPILDTATIENLDVVDKKMIEDANKLNVKADDAFVERYFNAWLKQKCSPYAPHDSSSILKSAIYKWFSDNSFDDEADVQRIIACSESNQRELSICIESAKEEFAKTMDKETELRLNQFSIPDQQEFGEQYEKHYSLKHALQPFYRPKEGTKLDFFTERYFEESLEKSTKVVWWYRNGTSEPKYFGVPYKKLLKNGLTEEKIFFPDYIVKFTDGTIGVFDTKAGDTTDPEAQMGEAVDEKANALQAFVHDYANIADVYRKQGMPISPYNGIWGGIVNVLGKDNYMLQGDAVTREIAVQAMNGDTASLDSVIASYDSTYWMRLDF